MTSSLFGRTQRSTWFAADHYLGCEQAIRWFQRPFGSVDEMNKTIIDRHNMLIEDHDIVWLLGNIVTGEDFDASLKLIKELNGVKYLIAGRRDRCFDGFEVDSGQRDPKYRDQWVRRYLDAGIKHVVTGSGIAKRTGKPVRIRLGNWPVDLAHFARDTDGPAREDYPRPWRPRRVPGAPTWLVHGSVHTAWIEHDRQINVGVDAWNFSPVPAEVIAGLIDDHDNPENGS